jgi:hypothetical protein
MRPAGLAAFEARDPGKTAIYSYEQAEAALTDDETALIRRTRRPGSPGNDDRRPIVEPSRTGS